jgi:hypothetical protein
LQTTPFLAFLPLAPEWMNEWMHRSSQWISSRHLLFPKVTILFLKNVEDRYNMYLLLLLKFKSKTLHENWNPKHSKKIQMLNWIADFLYVFLFEFVCHFVFILEFVYHSTAVLFLCPEKLFQKKNH